MQPNYINKTNNTSSIKQSFLAIAKNKLTSKEKQVISFLSAEGFEENLTKTVKKTSDSIQFSQSTTWFVVRKLMSMGMIELNSKAELSLSKAARLLVKEGL